MRPTRLLLAFALAIIVWRLLAHDTPLSALLLAAPPLGLAAAPSASRRWRTLLALAAVGAALPLLTARGVADGRSAVAWWPLAVKAWCSAGVVLTLAGSVARARALPLILRPPVWAAVAAVGAMLAVILPKLYRHQVVLRAELWNEAIFAGAEHGTLVVRDGTRLATTWLPGRPDAGVLVLTHGIGGHPQQFLGLTTQLRARGWSVAHWDLRGHGRSSPAAVTYGARESDDLAQVWEHLRATRAAGRPMVAYGGSMGGAVVLLAGHRLAGCDGILAESAFAELLPLVAGNLPGPLATVGAGLARFGLRFRLGAVRPVDSPVLREGPPLLLAASTWDAVVPIGHHLRLATASPRAATLVNPQGAHLDAIYAPGWDAALAGLLDAAEAYHRVHDGLGEVAPLR